MRQHIHIPFALLQSAEYLGLRLTDCIIYAHLTDRAALSVRSERYRDAQGVFVLYRSADLAALCRCGRAAVGESLRRLREAGLVRADGRTDKRGMQLAPRLYPALFSPPREAGYPNAPTAAEIVSGALPPCSPDSFGWRGYGFFMLPLALPEGLSLRAAVLYAILCTRLRMQKESPLSDERGQYCMTTEQELSALLLCSTRSVQRDLDALAQARLVFRRRDGLRNALRCYVFEENAASFFCTDATKPNSRSDKTEQPMRQNRTAEATKPNTIQIPYNQNNNQSSFIRTAPPPAERRDVFSAFAALWEANQRPDAVSTSTMMRFDRRKPLGVSENRPPGSRASPWLTH